MKSIFVVFLLISLSKSQDFFNFNKNFVADNLQLELHDEENTQNLIFNGQTADDSQFPYFALLYIDNIYLCGGSIIDEEFILTVSTKLN